MALTFTSCLSRIQIVSSFSSDFQLRMVEEPLRLTPTPRRSIIDVFGSPAAASDSASSSIVAASRNNVDRSDGHASDDDDVVAIAAIANAAADARSSSSEHSDGLSDDTMGGTPHLFPSDSASASFPSTFPDGDDVQQMLLQVQPLLVCFVQINGVTRSLAIELPLSRTTSMQLVRSCYLAVTYGVSSTCT
jgi:hypothetical protein